MIPIFAMVFVGLLFGVLLGFPVLAQTEVPHGVAEWVAGVELWILGGVAIVFIGVYGWLMQTVISQGKDIVRLAAWKTATEQRLKAGTADMDDLKGDIALANSRLLDIGGDLAFLRGKEEGRSQKSAAAQ